MSEENSQESNNVGEVSKTEVPKESSGEKTIQIKKSSLWKMGTGLFAILFIVSLFTGGFGGGDDDITGNTAGNNVPTNQPTQRPSIPTGVVDVSADDDPVKGDPDAPVTIIEFSDFECPFCGRWYSSTLPQIEEQYIKTGKVKLVYRDFPLSFHAQAQIAAEAAECADDQDKFWEMHDKIFENQPLLSEASLKQWAIEIGLDTGEFESCLSSGKHKSEIQNDLNEGQQYGVTGTPGFFVNGKLLVGAQPFSVFQQAIDAELN